MKIYTLKNLRDITIGPLKVNGRTIRLSPYQTIESDREEDFSGFRRNPYYRVEVIDVPDEVVVEQEVLKVEEPKTETIIVDDLKVDVVVPDSFGDVVEKKKRVVVESTYDLFLDDLQVNTNPIETMRDVAKLIKVNEPENQVTEDSLLAAISKKFRKSNNAPVTYSVFTIKRNIK